MLSSTFAVCFVFFLHLTLLFMVFVFICIFYSLSSLPLSACVFATNKPSLSAELWSILWVFLHSNTHLMQFVEQGSVQMLQKLNAFVITLSLVAVVVSIFFSIISTNIQFSFIAQMHALTLTHSTYTIFSGVYIWGGVHSVTHNASSMLSVTSVVVCYEAAVCFSLFFCLLFFFLSVFPITVASWISIE